VLQARGDREDWIVSATGSRGPQPVARLGPGVVAALALTAVVTFAALSRVGCDNRMTPAGHEGYVKTNPIFGAAEYDGIQRGPTSTGWVWRREVINIDTRPRTLSEDMQILTAERLELQFRAHARIQLREGSVKDLVEQYGGEDWYVANVQQQFRAATRSKVQELEAFEVKDRMDEIAEAVLADMKGRYANTPIEFLSVDIGNIEYPVVVVDSVVKKFVTNENNERKDIELEIARRQIDIGIAEAQGVADAQQIIRTTLDPMFLQYEALKAVEQLADSKNTTFVVVPYSQGGNAPLIMNVGD
jgi:regulator of protease activity HflC (stomatin/prohibitin superfamily)